MGTAPRKQLFSKAALRPALAEFDPLLNNIHAVKTNAEKLADELINDKKIEELAEKLVDSYVEESKLKNNPADAEELSRKKEAVGNWTKYMVSRGDVEEIKMNYVNSALRLCCFKQIDMEKQ